MHDLQISEDESLQEISFTDEKIGLIDYVDTVYLGFYLDLEKQYGIFISEIFVIVFFEFDTGAPWFETTGSRNNLASSVVTSFRNNEVSLVAWYYDRENDVLIVIDNLDYIH